MLKGETIHEKFVSFHLVRGSRVSSIAIIKRQCIQNVSPDAIECTGECHIVTVRQGITFLGKQNERNCCYSFGIYTLNLNCENTTYFCIPMF